MSTSKLKAPAIHRQIITLFYRNTLLLVLCKYHVSSNSEKVSLESSGWEVVPLVNSLQRVLKITFLFLILLPTPNFFLNLFIYFWLCWAFVSVQGLSLVAASGGHSSQRCAGLSLSRPLLLQSTGSRRAGSVIVAHGPSCSAAGGIVPDQGSNPCPLHWQADFQPLHHQGRPHSQFLFLLFLCLESLGSNIGKISSLYSLQPSLGQILNDGKYSLSVTSQYSPLAFSHVKSALLDFTQAPTTNPFP